MNYLGTNGIFLGLVVALVAVPIYCYVTEKGWTIKMPDGVPPAVSQSFEALIPSAVVMLVFFAIRIIFGLTPYETLYNFIFEILQVPLKGAGNTLTARLSTDLPAQSSGSLALMDQQLLILFLHQFLKC